MELILERKFFKENYTIGNLSINGKFFCNTIEDKNRDLNKNGKFDNGEYKVYAQTCIPFGEYKVVLFMSPKYKRLLPKLLNVPHFEGILIHNGTDENNTSGCIIVGENKIKGKVINSTKYMNELTNLIEKAINNGENVTIKII